MWEIIGKLKTPQEGEVSPLILQLVVALIPFPCILLVLSPCEFLLGERGIEGTPL